MTEPERLPELFARALALAGEERAAFLERVCASSTTLGVRLRELLAAHEALEAEEDEPGGDPGRPGFLEGLDVPRAATLLDSGGADGQEGATIGRYRVLRRLGRGGMGVVYLATDPVLDRPVALKLLPRFLGADPEANRRLVREARAASALDHPGVGTVYEVGETDDGRVFIAMAYYPGETLRERLARGPLPVEEAVALARQVADGLAAAHGAGIVHHDIKPENLVVGPHGIKILDFGLARMAAATHTRTGATLGTVAYMSPEQTRGTPTDARTDLWSLGVVLYEMLTGRRPFGGDGSDAVIYRIRHDPPEPLPALRPGVPRSLAAAVERCLEKDPARRFRSAGELRRALDLATRSPGRAPPRARAPALLAALAVLALAAASAWLWSGGHAPGPHAPPGTVVVAEVQTATPEDDGIALAVREALMVDLQQSRFVRILDGEQLSGVLHRMGMADTARLEPEVALEAAERAGAGAVLALTVARLGPEYVLSGRALRPADGEQMFAVRASATEDRLLDAVERLSREMRRRLGEQRDALGRSRPLPAVSTASLPALRLYAEAERLRTADPAAAAALLAEAIRTDSAFAMAHRLAAAVAHTELRVGDARDHITRAYRWRDRLTERERWLVEGSYHSTVTLHPRRAAEAYELLLRRYPDDWRATFNLGATVGRTLGEHERSHRLFLRASRLQPAAAMPLEAAIHTAYTTGRPARADSLAAAAERRGLGDIALQWRAARAFAGGDARAAAAACDSLLAGKGPGRPSLGNQEFCGSVDVASGRLGRGIRRLETVQRGYLEAKRYHNAAIAGQAVAQAHALGGDTAAAVAHLERLLALLPADSVPEPDRFIARTSLRVQALLLGRPGLSGRIAAAYPPFQDPEHWFGRARDNLVRAAGAVEKGDGHAALAALDAGSALDRDGLDWRAWTDLLAGMAWEQAGNADSATVRYRHVADPRYHTIPFLTIDRVFLPVALHRLAAVERVRGNEPGAAAAEHRLRRLWSDADAEPATPGRLP